MKKDKYDWGEKDTGLDFLDTSSDSATEDMILEHLASIMADMYLVEEAKKDIVSKQ